MSKYFLHGKLSAKEGQGDVLADILLQGAKSLSAVKGCISYFISKDPGNNNTIWTTEIWESKEDHDNSIFMDEVRILISLAQPLIDGQPEKGQELEIAGGLGV